MKQLLSTNSGAAHDPRTNGPSLTLDTAHRTPGRRQMTMMSCKAGSGGMRVPQSHRHGI